MNFISFYFKDICEAKAIFTPKCQNSISNFINPIG